jgi:hypothetical protein
MKIHLLFRSTRDAVKAEKILVDSGVPAIVVPVPKALSSDCGVSLETEQPFVENSLSLLAAAGIEAVAHPRSPLPNKIA